MISALHAQINSQPFTQTEFDVLRASTVRASLRAHTKLEVSLRHMYCICIISPIVKKSFI